MIVATCIANRHLYKEPNGMLRVTRMISDSLLAKASVLMHNGKTFKSRPSFYAVQRDHIE